MIAINYTDEILQLKNRINDLEGRVSKFYDEKHAESLDLISQDEDAICELSEETSESISDLEDAICELTM